MYNDEQLQNSQDSNIEKTWSKKFTNKWTNISKSLKLYKLLIDSLHITGGFFLYRITLVMGSRKYAGPAKSRAHSGNEKNDHDGRNHRENS